MLKKITLVPDVPVDLALVSTEGKIVERKYKGLQRMYSTVDNRVLYLPPDEGAVLELRIRELGIHAGDRILLYKERSYESGKLVCKLNVYVCSQIAIGEQPNGTFVLPPQPGAKASAYRQETFRQQAARYERVLKSIAACPLAGAEFVTWAHNACSEALGGAE